MSYWKRLLEMLVVVAWLAVLIVLMGVGMFQNLWFLIPGALWFASGVAYVVWDTFDR